MEKPTKVELAYWEGALRALEVAVDIGYLREEAVDWIMDAMHERKRKERK